MEFSSCRPNFKLEVEAPHFHSETACDRPETIKTTKHEPIPKVVWQQPPVTFKNQCNLNTTNKSSTNQYTQENSKKSVATQTLPPRGIQPQNYVVTTEQPPINQLGNESVPFLNCSKNGLTDIQDTEQHATTTFNGDTTIPPLTISNPLIEERLVIDEQTIEFYLPLTCTVVLKRKQEKLFVPLDFENNLTVYALVDSGAYVSAIAHPSLRTVEKLNPFYNLLETEVPINITSESK